MKYVFKLGWLFRNFLMVKIDSSIVEYILLLNSRLETAVTGQKYILWNSAFYSV
jgi:hypothetical protein